MTTRIWVACERGFDIVLIDNIKSDMKTKVSEDNQIKSHEFFIKSIINHQTHEAIILWTEYMLHDEKEKFNSAEEMQIFIVAALIEAIKKEEPFFSMPDCIDKFNRIKQNRK